MDNIYIDKVLKGDINAFQYFVKSYKDFSFSLSYSILKDTHLSEESVQESFIKAFENLQCFRKESSFKSWFGRIVINESLRRVTSNDRNKVSMDKLPEEEIKQIDDAIFLLTREEQKFYITEVFEKLSSTESLVLDLFYLQEYSINEIVELTGWSRSKIKMLLHRGRKNFYFRLSKILKNELLELI